VESVGARGQLAIQKPRRRSHSPVRYVSATPASSYEASATAKTRRSKESKLDAVTESNLNTD
jgi:hypothetical protein